jgi:hypothetical protein
MIFGQVHSVGSVTLDDMQKMQQALETGEAVGHFTRQLIHKMLNDEDK